MSEPFTTVMGFKMICVYRQHSDQGDKKLVAEFSDKTQAEEFIISEIEKFPVHEQDAQHGRWWARDDSSPPNYYFWTE